MQHKLKALLFEKQMTQYKLAEKLNLSPATLSDKIRGKTEFTFSEVYDICVILKIDNPLNVFVAQKKGNNNGRKNKTASERNRHLYKIRRS